MLSLLNLATYIFTSLYFNVSSLYSTHFILLLHLIFLHQKRKLSLYLVSSVVYRRWSVGFRRWWMEYRKQSDELRRWSVEYRRQSGEPRTWSVEYWTQPGEHRSVKFRKRYRKPSLGNRRRV